MVFWHGMVFVVVVAAAAVAVAVAVDEFSHDFVHFVGVVLFVVLRLEAPLVAMKQKDRTARERVIFFDLSFDRVGICSRLIY